MTNILDVVIAPRKVKTNKLGELDVYGLSIEGLVILLKAQPKLLDLFQGNKLTLDVEQILALGLDVAGGFMAAGLGHPGDDKVIAKCRAFNPEDAMLIASAILEETFPGGAENFFKKISAMATSAQVLASATPAEGEAAKVAIAS